MSTPAPAPAPVNWKAAKEAAKAQRPWYKKKRFILPLILLALIIISQLAGGGDDPGTATPTTPAVTQEDTTADEPTVEEPAAEEPVVEPEPAEEPAIVVSSAEMIATLEANALNAKNTYEGKRVTVSGFVGSIDASGDYFALDPEPEAIIFTGIQVQTGEEFLGQVSGFTAGQPVTVTGTVTSVGEIMGYSIDTETIQ